VRMRIGVIVGVLLVVGLGFVAWNNNRDRPQSPDATSGPSPPVEVPAPAEPQVAPPPAADPGIAWTVPKAWLTQIEGEMRIATYIVPGATRDDDAECAVYYFGPGAGGGVDLNLKRWQDEFATVETRDLQRRDVHGIAIVTLALTGTYSGHTMRTDAAAGPHAHWSMLAAIVSGPRGDVFFKLTGPATTVAAAATPFDAMLGSIRAKPAS